jgi:hypothetical protein
MQDADGVERNRTKAVLAAFTIGEWLMLSTAVILFLWPVLAGMGLALAAPPGSVVSMTPLIVLSLAFAWSFRWLRGAAASLPAVVLWIATAWSVIVFEAFR